MKSMTDISDAVAKSTGISRSNVGTIVKEAFEEVGRQLASDGEVQLRGFGTFRVKRRAQRKGRNPATGENFTIAARKAATFKPSSDLAKAVA